MQACNTGAETLRPGERRAGGFHSVVMCQNYDEHADFAAELVVLATFGTVPGQ